MITIYHNARCRKSREGLELLKQADRDFKVREYLKEPLTEEEIEKLLEKLQITPVQLIRTNEDLWKKEYREKDLSDRELIRVMAEHPKLIERPIVEKDDRAVIGRPAPNIEKLFE